MFLIFSHNVQTESSISLRHYNIAISYAVATEAKDIILSKKKVIRHGLCVPESLGNNEEYDNVLLYEYLIQLSEDELQDSIDKACSIRGIDTNNSKFIVQYNALFNIIAGAIANRGTIPIGAILNRTEQKIRDTGLAKILQDIIKTPLMREKIKFTMIRQFRQMTGLRLLNSENYYLIEDLVMKKLQFNNYLSNDKMDNEDANFNGLVVNKIKITIQEEKSTLCNLLSTEGTKNKHEDDYNAESSTTVEVLSKNTVNINFQEFFHQLSDMQNNLLRHSNDNSKINELRDDYTRELELLMNEQLDIKRTKLYRERLIYEIPKEGRYSSRNIYIYLINFISFLQDMDLIERHSKILKHSKNTLLTSGLVISTQSVDIEKKLEPNKNTFMRYEVSSKELTSIFREKSNASRQAKISIEILKVIYKYAKQGITENNIENFILEIIDQAKINTGKATPFTGQKKVPIVYYEDLPVRITQNKEKYTPSSYDWDRIYNFMIIAKNLNLFLTYLENSEYTIHNIDPVTVLDRREFINYNDLDSYFLFNPMNKGLKITATDIEEITAISEWKQESLEVGTLESFDSDNFKSQPIQVDLSDLYRPVYVTKYVGTKAKEKEENFLENSVLVKYLSTLIDWVNGYKGGMEGIAVETPRKNQEQNSLEGNIEEFRQIYQKIQNVSTYVHVPINHQLAMGVSVNMLVQEMNKLLFNSREFEPLTKIFSWHQYSKDEDGTLKFSAIEGALENQIEDAKITSLVDNGYENVFPNEYMLTPFTHLFDIKTYLELQRFSLIYKYLSRILENALADFSRRVFSYYHLLNRNSSSSMDKYRITIGEFYNDVLMFITLSPHKLAYKLSTLDTPLLSKELLDVLPSNYFSLVEDQKEGNYLFLHKIIDFFRLKNANILQAYKQEFEKYNNLMQNNIFFGQNNKSSGKAKALIENLRMNVKFINLVQWRKMESFSLEEDISTMTEIHFASKEDAVYRQKIGGFMYEDGHPITKVNKAGILMVLYENNTFYGFDGKGMVVSENSRLRS